LNKGLLRREPARHRNVRLPGPVLVAVMFLVACLGSCTTRSCQGPDKTPPTLTLDSTLELPQRQFVVPSAYLGQERPITALLPPGDGGEALHLIVSGTLGDQESGLSSVLISCTHEDGDPRRRIEETRTYPPGTASARYTARIPVTEGRWTIVVMASDRAGTQATTSATLTISVPHPDAYATLYVNDGEGVGELRLAETLGRLYLSKEIRSLVVIAVASMDRRREYGASDGRISIPCDFGDGLPPRGDRAVEYERFLVSELVPRVRAMFRVSHDPRDTGLLGVSLGGLTAFSIAWDRSDVFGLAGALSASFWWRETAGSLENRQATRIMHRLVREGAHRPLRAWFEAGTEDEHSDRNGNGVIDVIEDTLDLIAELEKKGYARGRDIAYVEVPGGKHSYETWAPVMPNFLRWAYPAR
jgi:enterochelin esterase-like enzyme